MSDISRGEIKAGLFIAVCIFSIDKIKNNLKICLPSFIQPTGARVAE